MSDHCETKYEMLRAGYKFLGKSKCKSCTAPIEWWQTGRGKKIPLDPTPESEHAPVRPHWATCPHADQHRQPKDTQQARSLPVTQTHGPKKLDAHQQYLAAFRASSNARVIVAIYDDGTAAVWRKGIPGEDIRHELITEANNLRNHIAQEN
jgi:hypothetical protein